MDHPEQHNRYDELAKKLLDGTISDAERQAYFDWLDEEEDEPLSVPRHFAVDETELKTRIYSGLESAMHQTSDVDNLPVARPPSIPLSRRWYRFAAAAAILVLVAGAAYLWVSKSNDQPKLATVERQIVYDVLPGHDGAILTLANGKQLVLDSLGNGTVARQGNTDVVISNGRLVYNDLHGSEDVLYNSINTPRGRQYQLVLPDGSKVWLNAASSITYPASFTGKQRLVKITGEVYFEVAPSTLPGAHTRIPFIVDVDGKQTVEVLGTHFNINSYGDEGAVYTTLLEGKVKVSATQPETRNAKLGIVLIPGQQAILQHNRINTTDHVDLTGVMSWKNGFFQFDETSLELVLKQLERWYDIDVVFEGKIPEESFVGELPRNAPLSQVLRVLEKTGIKFRIEGKKLIVMS